MVFQALREEKASNIIHFKACRIPCHLCSLGQSFFWGQCKDEMYWNSKCAHWLKLLKNLHMTYRNELVWQTCAGSFLLHVLVK